MENNKFIVSARKYRPTTFSSVVGQKNLTATLQNAITSDRLAHSYLFCGSRGVGKTSCARIFAKTINCEHRTPQGDPCNECESCRSFNEGRSFNIIEMDAASNNGVEDIRKLTEQVMVPPTQGRYRVFIIDEVHMLSSAAFNAFLKTLEEPPSYVIFILATTEKHKIIPTILSRCQIYDFNRITVNDIVDHLEHVAQAEGVTTERKALSVIATQADGALRDALSIFDQIVASTRGNITYEGTINNLSILDNKYFLRLMEAFGKSDVAESLLIFKEIRDKGFNTLFFIHGLQQFIRDLMVARDSRTLSLLDLTDEEKKQMQELAQSFSPEFYYMALSLINDADLKYREAANKTFLTELLLIKLCQLLSPSPIFRGKEEGHIDSLLPLGSTAPATPLQPSQQSTPASDNAGAESKPVMVNIAQALKQTPAPGSTPIPAPRPQADPQVKRKILRSIGTNVVSLNLNEPKADTYTKQTELPIADSPESAPATLAEAWQEYITTIPQKKIVVNLMKYSPPQEKEGEANVVVLVVGNELQKEIFEQEEPYLKPWLIRKLGISDLHFEIIIDDTIQNPEMWSDREVLEHMIEAHPALEKFIHDLGLSLS